MNKILAGLFGISVLMAGVAQADTVVTFLDLTTHDEIANNSLKVGGSAADLTVTRSYDVSNDYLYAITYTGSDYDGDLSNDTLSFTVRVAGFTGTTAYHGLSGYNTTTDATATIGTTDEAVSLNITTLTEAGWTVGADNKMYPGDTLKFSVENITVSGTYVGRFSGFNGFRYDEDGGFGHGFVVGEGTGLFGRTWAGPADESIADVTSLFLSDDPRTDGSGAVVERWGVANVDFKITVEPAKGTVISIQ